MHRTLTRRSRASAMMELTLMTAIVLIPAIIGGVDLYARVSTERAVGDMARALADYAARDEQTDAGTFDAYGQWLHTNAMRWPASSVAIVTLVGREGGDPDLSTAWSDDALRIGPGADELATRCPKLGDPPQIGTMPTKAGVWPEEQWLIVVELCTVLHRQGSLTGLFTGKDMHRIAFASPRSLGARPKAPVR